MELSTQFVLSFLAVAAVLGLAFFTRRIRSEVEAKSAARRIALREIRENAERHGRRFDADASDTSWTLSGDGWTLAYKRGTPAAEAVDVRDGTAIREDETIRQSLAWRCPSVRRKHRAFRMIGRIRDTPSADEVALAGDSAWARWRVVASDPDLARRAFSPAVVELIERLPQPRNPQANIDQRTWIELDADGLSITLGIDALDAGLVELLIELGETLARELR